MIACTDEFENGWILPIPEKMTKNSYRAQFAIRLTTGKNLLEQNENTKLPVKTTEVLQDLKTSKLYATIQ
jgi:hypothetical protein